MRVRIGRILLIGALAALVVALGHQIGAAQQPGSTFQFYDVPEAQQEDIRQEWAAIVDWMANTYEISEPVRQFHIGQTDESVSDLTANATSYGSCGWGQQTEPILILILSCDRPESLVGWFMAFKGIAEQGDIVVEDGHLRRGPWWLNDGLFHYLNSKFAAHRGADLSAERTRRQFQAPSDWSILSEMETNEQYGRRSPEERGLGWLAVDWLVQRAGETSYVEYMTQRGEYREWHEAFEAKFGLTPDEFYTQFEEARPEFERIVTGGTEEDADAEEREGIWLSTPLYPGMNLIGWLEASLPIEKLFAAIPRIESAHVWDGVSQSWSMRWSGALFEVWPDGVGPGVLRTLKPGMGVWLKISDGPPMYWDRRVTTPGPEKTTLTGYAQLGSGLNFVAWAGQPNSFEPLEDVLNGVYEWDAAYQKWVQPRYEKAVLVGGALQTARGYALMVQISSGGLWRQFVPNWWPDASAEHDWIASIRYWGDVGSPNRERLLKQINDVVMFFEEEYKTIADPSVFVAADEVSGASLYAQIRGAGTGVHCGHADTHEIILIIDCRGRDMIDSATFAHEYFHALQNSRYNPRYYTATPLRDDAPFWLTEGGATYANALYDAHRGHRSYETQRHSWVRSTEQISESLSQALVSGSNAPYVLGALASERLADKAGEASLIEYFSNRTEHATTEETFEATFGLALDAFYEEFADWRAAGFAEDWEPEPSPAEEHLP